jgi:hypothetical protein
MVMKKAFADLAAVAALGVAALLPTKADAWWEWDVGKAYTAYPASPRGCDPYYCSPGDYDYGYRPRTEWRGRAPVPKHTLR